MVKRTRKNNRRRAQVGKPRTVVSRLPSPYNRLSADSTVLKCRGVLTLRSNSVNYAGGTLGLWPSVSTTPSLSSLVLNLNALPTLYDYFTVLSMTVRVMPTVPSTVGSVLAVGYEPQPYTENRDPQDLADVLISKHHATTNQTGEVVFNFQPCRYRNDWSKTEGSTDSSVGYLQWLSTYAGISAQTIVGYLDISFDIAFAGLKRSNQ